MLRKIIKCPNCKSDVLVLSERGGMSGLPVSFQAVCSGCDIRGPVVNIGALRQDVAKAKAVDDWNAMARRLGASDANVTLYRDSMLTPGKSRATAKQISYAKAIAERLGIDPPEEPAKDIYRRFISTHVAEFKRRAPDPVPLRPRTPDPEPEVRDLDSDWGHGYCGWDHADTDDTHIGPP